MKANLEVVSSKKQGRIGMILMAMTMVFAVMFSVILIAPNRGVKAGAGDDNPDDAVVLKANEPVTSSLSSAEDVNWYKFEIQNSVGVEQFIFQSVNLEKPDRFRVYLYKEVNGYPTELMEDSTFYMGGASYSSEEYSYPKGTVFYVKVIPSGYGDQAGDEYKVYFKTSTEPVKDCEWAIEDDKDNADGAELLIGGKKKCGLINTNEDTDWFKYEVKSEDSFKFIMMSTNYERSDSFRVLVYEENNGIPGDCIEDSGIYTGKPSQYTSKDLSYEKGTTLFIKVQKGAGNCDSVRYIIWAEDKVGAGSDKVSKLDTPYSILAGTNVIVGKAEAGATVYAKYGKKTYSAVADENGIYRIVTANLKKGKSVKLWQKVGKKTSAKQTVKVVAGY